MAPKAQQNVFKLWSVPDAMAKEPIFIESFIVFLSHVI